MVKCDKCDKEFTKKYLLKRHLNRKYPCMTYEMMINKYNNQLNDINNDIIYITKLSIESILKCNFCNKKLANINNLERHIEHSCLIKKEMLNNKNKLIEKITKLEKIEKDNKLQNQIKKLQNIVEILSINNDIIINNNINKKIMI